MAWWSGCTLQLYWLCFYSDSSLLIPDEVPVVLLKQIHPPLKNQDK